MKKFLAVLLAAVLALTVMACFTGCGEEGGTADPTGTFKMGFIGPLTGGAAIYGSAARDGAQIAVDEINALNGDIKFEFRAEDDEHDPEKSMNAYNILKDWGAQIINGTVTTGPCINVSAQAFADRMFMITPSASSVDVISDKDNICQVCFTDPNQGIASADYMAANMADKKIAVIYRNDDAYSQGIYEKFAEECGVKGLSIVYAGTFTDATATDFSVQLTAAQSAGAELIFLPIYYTPASVILKQAHDMNYAPLFFGVDGMDGILAVEGFDTALAEGVYLLTPFSADAQDEKTKSFVAKYQEKYNAVPNQFAADGYDTVYAFYEALKKAGATGSMTAAEICEKLIPVMTQIKVDGITGSMTWDADGAVSKDPRAVVIKDGAYVSPENA